MRQDVVVPEGTGPNGPSAVGPRLLRTKLYVPRAHPGLLPRDRILSLLDAGMTYRLTLVSAPAGYGKTTLVSDWIRRRGFRPAWLSLDAADSDPRRFWAYALAALDTVHSDLGRTAAELLRSPQAPPIEAVLSDLLDGIATWLESDMNAPASGLILVLDDYHFVDAPAIHRAVEFLLLHLPPRMRVIIASRQDPPLPLALLRARGELLELRAGELRFSQLEAAAFLNTFTGLNLTAEDAAALEARTEGWAAGLQLAALSMQGLDDTAGFIREFAGSHRFVFDYLAQEVLGRQPAPVRDFLLKTAVLERLSGPLCDAVTGASDGQAMLETLEQANLFLLPLDHERRWYRYHSLFAEFLRLQAVEALGEEAVVGLERRASAWYVKEGLIEDAVHHALGAGDVEQAADLIEQSTGEMFLRSELATLCAWLGALPESLVVARPRLGMAYSWALMATGRPGEAERWAQAVERAVGADVDALAGQQEAALAPEVRAALVEVGVLRGALAIGHADVARAQELMERVLLHLAREGPPYLLFTAGSLRPAALYTLASAYEAGGDAGRASRVYAGAAESSLQGFNPSVFSMALSRLARLQVIQGQLHQAEKTYRRAIEGAESLTAIPSPLSAIAYVGLGGLLYEWNDLESASAALDRGIALARPWHALDALVPGYQGLAALGLALGDEPGAAAALDALRGIERMHPPPQAAVVAAGRRALLEAGQGDLRSAAHWAASSDIDPDGDIPCVREEEAIVLARLSIALGRLAAAQRLLTGLLVTAEAGQRAGLLIELYVLHALVLHALGQGARAVQSLQKALILAEPESYVRTFVDAGAPMAVLLSQVDILPIYVAQLRTALGAGPPRPRGAGLPAGETPPTLVEPLTERELEVLRLIAAGLSNPQIAGRLVVSLNTVKTHVKNIHGKLGTANRIQAVARARELGLLSL